MEFKTRVNLHWSVALWCNYVHFTTENYRWKLYLSLDKKHWLNFTKHSKWIGYAFCFLLTKSCYSGRSNSFHYRHNNMYILADQLLLDLPCDLILCASSFKNTITLPVTFFPFFNLENFVILIYLRLCLQKKKSKQEKVVKIQTFVFWVMSARTSLCLNSMCFWL